MSRLHSTPRKLQNRLNSTSYVGVGTQASSTQSALRLGKLRTAEAGARYMLHLGGTAADKCTAARARDVLVRILSFASRIALWAVGAVSQAERCVYQSLQQVVRWCSGWAGSSISTAIVIRNIEIKIKYIDGSSFSTSMTVCCIFSSHT